MGNFMFRAEFRQSLSKNLHPKPYSVCDKAPVFPEYGLVKGVPVAEWIHFTLFRIVLPTIKLKAYAFGGLMNSATKRVHAMRVRGGG